MATNMNDLEPVMPALRRDDHRDGGGVMLVPCTEHVGDRPSWACRACGEQWPCAVARKELKEQYDGWQTGLIIYLTSRVYEAIEDARKSNSLGPTDLVERFVGWAR
jgi:hypothetical protein